MGGRKAKAREVNEDWEGNNDVRIIRNSLVDIFWVIELLYLERTWWGPLAALVCAISGSILVVLEFM